VVRLGRRVIPCDELLIVRAPFPNRLVWSTAVCTAGWVCGGFFAVRHQVVPRTCPAPGPSLTVLISMRVVQAAGAYWGPLTVFWLDGDFLGQDFGKGVDFLVGFVGREFDKEKRDGSFRLVIT